MKQAILLEKLMELIGDRQVIAAVFYTFNFDARFFENYLLPVFVPDVEFSDNEIQNAILWKMYQKELPPVVVFCDDHMKGTEGPSLDYTVLPISLQNKGGYVPCFHAKHSFIRLSDDSLIIITGSNNLTVSGWCRNVEGYDIRRYSANGTNAYFPKNYLKEIRLYMTHRDSYWMNSSTRELAAISLIRYFIDKQTDTGSENQYFFTSHKETFHSFIAKLKTEINGSNPFQKIEIIAPYLSNGLNHFDLFVATTGCQNINIAIPFEGEDLVGMEEELFRTIDQHESYNWHYFDPKDNTKGFRFCHAKLYRFYGEKSIITIVGSVNFTDAAFKGVKQGGNLESAIATVEHNLEPKPWLEIPYNGTDSFEFTTPREEKEEEELQRASPYELTFEMDWLDNKLRILNPNPDHQKGKVIFENDNASSIRIDKLDKTMTLSNVQLQEVLSTNVIRVKPTIHGLEGIYHYFPKHINIESKPLPPKYNINDAELFQLWTELENAFDKKAKSRIIDRFIDRIVDQYEEDIDDNLKITKSILNQMASHLNGLLSLHRVLSKEVKVKQQTKRIQKIEYYLIADNVDTLVNYQKILKKLYSEDEINLGFYWLILSILDKYFYGNQTLQSLVKEESLLSLKTRCDYFRKTYYKIDQEMRKSGVPNSKLKWLKTQLHA